MRTLLQQGTIDVLDCTPTLLALWLDMGLTAVLPNLVVGGEAIPAALWASLVQWQQRHGRRAINAYGPTECCVDSTWGEIEGTRPHIGAPLPNTLCYVLDGDHQLSAVGSIGELHIGGTGLARGYLNTDELTAARFMPNPFSEEPPSRLYKSGDLVRYLTDADGRPDRLEFIGRMDDQVKVRGFRIELGEIEHQLSACPQVQSCLVQVLDNGSGDKQLVAYVIADDVPGRAESELTGQLRDALQQVLPQHMLPWAFVMIEQWPLTSNGKIDKKALPVPDMLGGQDGYVAPATDTERALLAIWKAG